MLKWQLKAIKELNSEAEYSFDIQNDSVTDIVWNENTTPISLDDINTKAEELKTAEEYQDVRKASYPSWQEQMDMQYWDNVNGTTTWADAIAKVKTNNPKA
jgi:hypothetical protein